MKCKCCNKPMNVYDQTVQDYAESMRTGQTVTKTYQIAECKVAGCDFKDITKEIEWFERTTKEEIYEMYDNVINPKES